MNERKKRRIWEWGTFGALLGVICVALTLVPMPQGGRSQVVPDRLFFLPIVPQSLELETAQQEESVEEEGEEALSAEEMAAMLAEAFGTQDPNQEAPERVDLSSQSADVLTVEGLNLDAWNTDSGTDLLGTVQRQGLDLRGRAPSSKRLAPTLIRPEPTGAGVGNLRIQVQSRGDTTAPVLETQAVARRAPITMDDFTEVVAEDALAVWIQDHPSAIDPGIRSLFRAGPTDVTARATMEIDGNALELHLMLAPINGEVRIALIQGESLYFFVSPKQRRQASYFQIGTIRRDEDGRIITIESEDLSPQGAEAQAFYGLFVAWWRTQNS